MQEAVNKLKTNRNTDRLYLYEDLTLSCSQLRSAGSQILEGCIAEIPNISSLDISDNSEDIWDLEHVWFHRTDFRLCPCSCFCAACVQVLTWIWPPCWSGWPRTDPSDTFHWARTSTTSSPSGWCFINERVGIYLLVSYYYLFIFPQECGSSPGQPGSHDPRGGISEWNFNHHIMLRCFL